MNIELLKPYKLGNKFGLITEKNKIVVNPIFDKMRYVEEDSVPITATLPDGRSFGFAYALNDLAQIVTNNSKRKFMTLNGEIVDERKRSAEEIEESLSKLYETFKQCDLEEQRRNICTDNQVHTNEFKRTCKMCGKIWYSSKDRESYLENQTQESFVKDFLQYFSGGTNDGINIVKQQAEFELMQMRSCPKCKSTNCDTED